MAKRSQKNKALSKKIPAKIRSESTAAQRLPFWLNRYSIFLGLILIVVIVLTYQPVWSAGYVWDDDQVLTANTSIVGPQGLKEIWTTSAAQFFPLVLTTFWMEHALWGLAPLPYHLVNVFIHAACAVLLWLVLRSLDVPGAWLGAALWALHPVGVESVAWISEMKNTESALFFLLSIFFFVRWVKRQDRREPPGSDWDYGLTLLFAALAMASKSSTVILPLVLCLCAWWVQRQWHWRNLATVSPIFLMSAFASSLTIWAVKLQGVGTDTQWIRSLPERLAAAGDAVWFYLGKLIWPHPLIAIYPRWQIDAGRWISFLPLIAVLIVLFIFWHKRESWSRPWFFVFAYFLAALLPVLGLVDHFILRYSLVFDHFQYLASMGPLALIGAALTRLTEWIIPKKQWVQSILCACVLLVLGLLSWQRAWAYEGGKTLWTDTVAQNPDCWLGYNNIGVALAQEGRSDEAIANFRKTVAINPNYPDAHSNLGMALLQERRVNEAIEEFQKALSIDSRFVDAHANLGLALAQTGQLDEAIQQYKKAVEINPKDAESRSNLGVVLARKGRVDEAIVQYQGALEINPKNAEAHNNLGSAFFQKGETEQAIAQFREALRVKPDYRSAQSNLERAVSIARESQH